MKITFIPLAVTPPKWDFLFCIGNLYKYAISNSAKRFPRCQFRGKIVVFFSATFVYLNLISECLHLKLLYYLLHALL